MLSAILGVNEVPLSYVVRENPKPTPKRNDTFVHKCTACAPLIGPHFEADARRVHQLATSFTQGEISKQWIKMHARQQNGRIDLEALYAHYKGAGNTTRRIAEAIRLSETLHYKNERSLSFTTFLSKMQHMFNLLEEENETMTEAAKLRFLLDKVNHPQLESDVSALRINNNHASGEDKVTFTKAENILAASVSSLPYYQYKSRAVSGVGTSNNGSIHRDGKIKGRRRACPHGHEETTQRQKGWSSSFTRRYQNSASESKESAVDSQASDSRAAPQVQERI